MNLEALQIAKENYEIKLRLLKKDASLQFNRKKLNDEFISLVISFNLTTPELTFFLVNNVISSDPFVEEFFDNNGNLLGEAWRGCFGANHYVEDQILGSRSEADIKFISSMQVKHFKERIKKEDSFKEWNIHFIEKEYNKNPFFKSLLSYFKTK